VSGDAAESELGEEQDNAPFGIVSEEAFVAEG
jgi:hypothetical protein